MPALLLARRRCLPRRRAAEPSISPRALQVETSPPAGSTPGIVDGQNKLVPSITFKLKNVSDQTLRTLQVNALFRRVSEPKDEWGSDFLTAAGSEGLAPGATTSDAHDQVAARLQGHGSARDDAAQFAVRRRDRRSVREVRIDAVDEGRRVPIARRLISSRRRDARTSASTPLGPLDAAAIVVSNVIGGGIFFVPDSRRAARAERRACCSLVWAAGGALAFAGALAYAELAALRPRAGGEYVYLREAYGRLPHFSTGWTSFVAGFSGAIAASAMALADYVGHFVPGAADADADR